MFCGDKKLRELRKREYLAYKKGLNIMEEDFDVINVVKAMRSSKMMAEILLTKEQR
jgi:hypothetical protein